MHQEPVRAFWHVTAHSQDGQAKNGTQTKAEPPAQVNRQDVRVEQDGCNKSAGSCADPPAPIDGEVHMAAHSRRDQFIDSRVNRGILPTDTGSRDEAAGQEPDEVEGKGGRDGSYQIDSQ